MAGAVHAAFEDRTIVLSLDVILPLRALAADACKSVRYRRVATSIAEVGVIEPIVVSPNSGREGTYLLLDGHVRLAILRDRGEREAICLVALEEDPFTYNKRVSHLAVIQGHFMIMRALERGVPEKKIADALDMDVARIRRQRTLLDGVCREVVDMLKDKQIAAGVFPVLKRMGPARQVEAVELMASCGNYTTTYADALLAGTKQAELAHPEKAKKVRGLSAEQMAKMEREMQTIQGNFKAVETTYGDDMLEMSIVGGYIKKLLRNPQVERYLAERHSEILDEFKAIVASNATDQAV